MVSTHRISSEDIPWNANVGNGFLGCYFFSSSYTIFCFLLFRHCIGYCDSCIPILDSEDFEMGCRSLKTTGGGSDDTDEASSGDDAAAATKTGHREYYSEKLVVKAVHLFRNPFDNLVARMHHGIKRRSRMPRWQTKARLKKRLARFQESTNGFVEWCYYLDNIFKGDFDEIMEREFNVVDEKVYRDLPCRTELFRYVQWHNAAIEVLQRLNVPVHVLYYEDYTTKYNQTVRQLFDFLELEPIHPNSPFLPGKTYDHVYSSGIRVRATKFVKAIASPACFDLIKHYFEPWLDDEDKAHGSVAHVSTSDIVKHESPKIAWLLSYPNSVSGV